MKRKLTVTTALYLQFRNNIQRRCSEHLIFPVRKSYGRCNYNAVAGMNANRIKIFHRTNGYNITLTVSDNFKLNLLPAAYALLN